MKKIFAVLICLSIGTLGFAQADPVEGFWLSVDEDTNRVTAGWQIFQENGILFGRILSLADEPRGTIATEMRASYNGFPIQGVAVNTLEVAGPPWIFGLTRRGPGDWRGGNIIDPTDGRMYGCRITFHPAGSRSGRTTFEADTLEMRGTIGPFGRSQFWRRTDQATASSLWPE